MHAGRQAVFQSHPDSYMTPVLITRASEERFWTGKAGYNVETFIHDGRLVAEAKSQDAFDPSVFANRLQTALNYLEQIEDIDKQLRARQLVAEVQDTIANSEPDQATQKLSEASTYIHLVISEQENRHKVQQEKKKAMKERVESARRARLTVLGVSTGLLLVVAILGYVLRHVWTPSMSIPVIAIPVSVVVWSFVGGVAAMLQVFVETKQTSSPAHVSYEWLLWRPIVGVVMGSVIYLAIAAGLVVLGQGDLDSLANTRNPYFIWATAFAGGFSDKFTILVFDNIVRTFSKQKGETEENSD
jgi:uncharacterized membrane protein